MIPQDPILFSGTLRFNLDPFDEVSDNRIIDLIKKAGLEYLLDGKSKQEILEEKEKLEQEKAKRLKQSTDDSAETEVDTKVDQK